MYNEYIKRKLDKLKKGTCLIMEKHAIKNWKDLTNPEISYHLSDGELTILENAIINKTEYCFMLTHSVSKVSSTPFNRLFLLKNGQGYCLTPSSMEDCFNYRLTSDWSYVNERALRILNSNPIASYSLVEYDFFILETILENWSEPLSVNNWEFKNGEEALNYMLGVWSECHD